MMMRDIPPCEREPALPAILVADDDTEMRRLLRAWLEPEGYRIEEVASGVELVEYIAHAWLGGHPERQPALMVSDVRMPGFDGISVLRVLRLIDTAVPVVVVTAFGDAWVHHEASRLCATAVLDKPVSRREFLDAVEDALLR